MKLFLSGFIQVFFMAINTCFLAKSFYIGSFIVAFLISITWSFNVKKIAFGSIKDRIIYSSGASLGSVSGLYFATLI